MYTLNDFCQLTAQYGIPYSNNPIIDGNIHRYAIPEDKRGKPCFYVLKKTLDGIIYGCIGCWKRGIKVKYCNCDEKNLTDQQKRAIHQKDIEIEEQLKKLHEEAKERARAIWNKSKEDFTDHPYLTAKGVKNYGLRLVHDTLLVPLFNSEGELCSLQFINANGDKYFLKNGVTQRCQFIIGTINENAILYLAEGYATAATIHEATKCPVIVAFNAGNLLPVAQAIRKKYPHNEIVICADNDAFTESGNVGVIKATAAAQAINAKIAIPQFKNTAEKPTDFNDLMLLEGNEEVKNQLNNTNLPNKNNMPTDYILDESGLYYVPFNSNGEPMPKAFICSPVKINAYTRDITGHNHGLLVEFHDLDKRIHQWAMPKAMLAGDGIEYRSNLLSMGLNISSNRKAREKFTDYLLTVKPCQSALCVEKTGWYQGVFMFPDGAIGKANNNEKIIFQSAKIDITGFKVSGTADDWRICIGKYCEGNSRLILGVSTALAAPLLHLFHEESGGIHLKGSSSIGKTITLRVSCSIWGEHDRLQTWRATSNGIEGVAALHNDSLLCLDEMGQLNPNDAGETAYMLANGIGKNRCQKDGTLSKKAYWKLLFLSTGEIGLTEQMRQIGKKTKAGQEVRLIEIPADAGAGLGIFENLHGFDNGADLARYLEQQTKKYYGAVIREFLKKITELGDIELKNCIEKLRREFLQMLVLKDVDGQVRRAAQRFSIIAAAGQLVTEFGIIGWQREEAFQAIKACFDSWINQRGGVGAQEDRQILNHVRQYFQANHASRFVILDSNNNETSSNNLKPYNNAGFVKKSNFENTAYFYVETKVFETEICNGFDSKLVKKICIDHGWLIPDKGGKATQPQRLPPSNKTRRVYCFSEKVLGDENEE